MAGRSLPPRYEQIILFGRSVGSGPTVYLASRRGAPEMHREKLLVIFAKHREHDTITDDIMIYHYTIITINDAII